MFCEQISDTTIAEASLLFFFSFVVSKADKNSEHLRTQMDNYSSFFFGTIIIVPFFFGNYSSFFFGTIIIVPFFLEL